MAIQVVSNEMKLDNSRMCDTGLHWKLYGGFTNFPSLVEVRQYFTQRCTLKTILFCTSKRVKKDNQQREQKRVKS